jgi:hypothetical protein
MKARFAGFSEMVLDWSLPEIDRPGVGTGVSRFGGGSANKRPAIVAQASVAQAKRALRARPWRGVFIGITSIFLT